MNKYIRNIVGLVVLAFGLLTIFLTTSVIFDLFDIRAKEGNYVLFIVQANFIAGWLYFIGAYGFFTKKLWTAKYLALATVILFIAFIGLNFHINAGLIYEEKTFYAMIFRTTLTLIFTLIAYFTINKKINNEA